GGPHDLREHRVGVEELAAWGAGCPDAHRKIFGDGADERLVRQDHTLVRASASKGFSSTGTAARSASCHCDRSRPPPLISTIRPCKAGWRVTIWSHNSSPVTDGNRWSTSTRSNALSRWSRLNASRAPSASSTCHDGS